MFSPLRTLVGAGIVNGTLNWTCLSSNLITIRRCVFDSSEMSCAIGSAMAYYAREPGFEPRTRHSCWTIGFLPYVTFVSATNGALNWVRLPLVGSKAGYAIGSTASCYARTPEFEPRTRHFLVVFSALRTLVSTGIVNGTLNWTCLSSNLINIRRCGFDSSEMSCAIGSAVACYAKGPGFEPQTRHSCWTIGFLPCVTFVSVTNGALN